MATLRPGMVNNWDLMEQQVLFYRDHLDIFIEDQFAPIRLTCTQHIIARQFGRVSDGKFVCSRGFGKTWLTSLCCFAICCLYPGTKVIVCSGTVGQATLILDKLKLLVDQNPNMQAQLSSDGSRTLISLSKDKGYCRFKNGSSIQSCAINSLRGKRAKIVVADETPQIDNDAFQAIVAPTKNYTRDICLTYGFKDFPSKSIAITSACEKTNAFYKAFLHTAQQMAKGSPRHFACALSYEAAIMDGISSQEFFQQEKERMPSSIYDMQYGSIFVGSSSNSAFPYQLTQGCRTLQNIQLQQPKTSRSRYVISLDIATSDADNADNAIFTVVKFIQKNDGSFIKRLVYIRSFHGKGLDTLARQMRLLYHVKFPSAQRLIYDARGLGDSFSKFMDDPWINPVNGKEMPPLVNDDEAVFNNDAQPILHPVRAVQTLNQHMANTLRVMFQKRTLQLPINSRIKKAKVMQLLKTDKNARNISEEQFAVFIQSDALQLQLSNVVQKVSAAGNYIYDTPRANMHKDRYSSLAMACDYISQLQEQSIRLHKHGQPCVGIATDF